MISNEPKNNPILTLQSKFHFGKYKDKSVKYIMESINPFYLHWLEGNLDWLNLNEELKDKLSKPVIITGFFKIPFGKYEGKNINFLIKNDIEYCSWFYEYLCELYNVFFDDDTFNNYQEELTKEKEPKKINEKNLKNEMFNFF
jgi:uncharacterized protein (DUF3820 family)